MRLDVRMNPKWADFGEKATYIATPLSALPSDPYDGQIWYVSGQGYMRYVKRGSQPDGWVYV